MYLERYYITESVVGEKKYKRNKGKYRYGILNKLKSRCKKTE